jgi:hypothetical protein
VSPKVCAEEVVMRNHLVLRNPLLVSLVLEGLFYINRFANDIFICALAVILNCERGVS